MLFLLKTIKAEKGRGRGKAQKQLHHSDIDFVFVAQLKKNTNSEVGYPFIKEKEKN